MLSSSDKLCIIPGAMATGLRRKQHSLVTPHTSCLSWVTRPVMLPMFYSFLFISLPQRSCLCISISRQIFSMSHIKTELSEINAYINIIVVLRNLRKFRHSHCLLPLSRFMCAGSLAVDRPGGCQAHHTRGIEKYTVAVTLFGCIP